MKIPKWLKIGNFWLGPLRDLLSKMFRPPQLVEMGSIPTCPMGWSWILSAPRGQRGQNGMKWGQIGSNYGQNWNSIWQISHNCDISYCSEVIQTLSDTFILTFSPKTRFIRNRDQCFTQISVFPRKYIYTKSWQLKIRKLWQYSWNRAPRVQILRILKPQEKWQKWKFTIHCISKDLLQQL